jgi:hypothetical protein
MNEEELLAGGLPELTEEELRQLKMNAEIEANQGAIPEPVVQTQPQVQEEPQVQQQQTPQKTKKDGWDEAAYLRGELNDRPYWERIDDKGVLRPVTTTPFLKEDGTFDYGKAAEYGAEKDVDVLAGLWDFAAPILNAIPGVTAKPVPKFQNEVAQTVREISSVVLPTMFIGATGTARLGALATKFKGVPGLKVLSDPFGKWLGNASFNAGSGAFVDYTVPMNQTDDNLLGSLQKTWPEQLGWIPDQLATLDGDHPETKRWKNVLEGTYLGLATDFLQGLAKTAAARFESKTLFGITPENETAGAWLKKNQVVDETPEAAVERSAAKRQEDLDEVGSYNFDKSTDPTESVFGYHDTYAYQESGIRSVDDLGIVGASIDQARISTNLGTIHGRVGSVMSEGALKLANESGENAELVIRGLAETLKEAGEYGYKHTDGRYLSAADIKKSGEELANDFYGMDLGELHRSLEPGSIYMPGIDADTGVAMMTSASMDGVLGAIRKYMDDFMNMDVAKARAYVATSTAGQISDMAEGMRLTEGSGSIVRAQEQILDRVEFLMAQRGITSYARGRALNMMNLRNRMTTLGTSAADKAEATRIQKRIDAETNKTLQMIEREKLKATEFTDRLKEINKTNPEFLGPLMMAWELSDGKISTITALNNYAKQSTGILSKAIIDNQPEIPSLVQRAFFSNIYNSVLSAVSTPAKAGISAVHLLAEKPIRHMAGALANKDIPTLRRGWYQYSSKMDSVVRAMKYATDVYKKSRIDPNIIAAREDLGKKGTAALELNHAIADAYAQKGFYGPQTLMQTIQDMQDLADSPAMRRGIRGMQAIDGFVQSMVADFEAKGIAWDEVTQGGELPFDAARAQEVAQKAHAKMFDENGIITDEAVLKGAGEISLNLANKANDDLSQLIKRFPILKAFLLFTNTPLNELKLGASYNPMGLFVQDLNKFKLKFEDMPYEEVEELLTARGVTDVSPATAKGKYSEIRADLMGRKALGNIFTGMAVALVLGDRLHGPGHYNRQVQKTRDESNWARSAVKGLDDKWYSIEGLGPITMYLNTVAAIMDNFDSLSPNDAGELLKKTAFVFGSSVTELTAVKGIEPFQDILRGDAGAINRWAGSFGPAAVMPQSSFMAEIARLMEPQLKLINNDLTSMIMNRNPMTKWSLPDKAHWITGEKVNTPDSMFARIVNTYLPWKISDEISPEEQFLIDIEYDATATLKTNGRGTKLTNDEQARILSDIGEAGHWRDGIRRVMEGESGKEFRKLFKEAQEAGVSPDKSNLKNIHRELDIHLRNAIGDALINNPAFTNIQRRDEMMKRKAMYLQSGDIKGAQRYLDYVKEKYGLFR